MKLPGPPPRPLPQTPAAPGHCPPSQERSLLSPGSAAGRAPLPDPKFLRSVLCAFGQGITFEVWNVLAHHLLGFHSAYLQARQPWRASFGSHPCYGSDTQHLGSMAAPGTRGPRVHSPIDHGGSPRPRAGARIHRAVVSPVDGTSHCPLPHPAPHLAGSRRRPSLSERSVSFSPSTPFKGVHKYEG